MANTHGFDFFEGTTNAKSNEPRVTIRRGGLMVITPAAVDILGDNVTHVQLGLNAKTNTVALRKADDKDKGRYRLRTQKNSPMLLVGSKKFFTHHNLNIDEAKTFDATQIAKGLVGITLDNGNGNAAPNAKGKGKAAKK